MKHDPMEKARSARWDGHPKPVKLKCTVCAKRFTVAFSRKDTAKYCSYHCHQIGEGRKGGVVRGEQMKAASQGKTYVKTLGRHTHRVMAERMIGRPLKPVEVVHHKDGNKLNNFVDNIEVLSSQGEHMARHRKEMLAARKSKHGY